MCIPRNFHCPLIFLCVYFVMSNSLSNVCMHFIIPRVCLLCYLTCLSTLLSHMSVRFTLPRVCPLVIESTRGFPLYFPTCMSTLLSSMSIYDVTWLSTLFSHMSVHSIVQCVFPLCHMAFHLFAHLSVHFIDQCVCPPCQMTFHLFSHVSVLFIVLHSIHFTVPHVCSLCGLYLEHLPVGNPGCFSRRKLAATEWRYPP